LAERINGILLYPRVAESSALISNEKGLGRMAVGFACKRTSLVAPGLPRSAMRLMVCTAYIFIVVTVIAKRPSALRRELPRRELASVIISSSPDSMYMVVVVSKER
jgi:hypothetical protein